jgi:hypothetical protein
MRNTCRVFSLLLALAVSACGAPETSTMTDTPASPEAGAETSAPAPRYKQNPHPRQRYEVTMTIADAPGPFASVEGGVSYDIANEECLPPMDSFSGAQTTRSRESIPVTYKQVSDNTYVGTIYVDRMLDGDYFGKGVCRWQLGGVSVSLKATGAPTETTFIPVLFPGAFLSERESNVYYWKGGYPRSEIENYPDYGQPDRSKYKPELRSELFSITLSPKAMTP